MYLLFGGLTILTITGCSASDQAEQFEPNSEPVVWRLDSLDRIGGHPVTIEGEPEVIDTPNGKAIEFDGVDDAIFLNVHPETDIRLIFPQKVRYLPKADIPIRLSLS